MRGISVLLIVILCVSFVQCANILGIWFTGEKNHFILGETLFIELARRGHNVTMVSPFYSKKSSANYTNIVLNGFGETKDFNPKIFLERNSKISNVVENIFKKTRRQTEITLANFDLNSLTKSGGKFDVIIADWFFNFAILYYGKKLNVPVIALSHQGADNVATILTGNPGEASYIAGIGLDFPVEMSFIQRFVNGIFYAVMNILGKKHIRYHQELLQKYFNDTMTTPEMICTLALVLSNSHYSFESPRPYVPNIIPIGGFHISPPKTLPEPYQSFLDSAQSGAIYCSLGSTSWKSTLPTKALDAIMKGFSDLHMKVIFEWNHDEIKNKPTNVLICSSCPHNDILAHQYVKIFICHGDLLSIIEAIHHAVPVLGIPFYEDQRINIVSAVRQGYARHLDLDDLTDENFSFAVHDLIFDPTFEEKIGKLSHLLKDQPVSPMDTAVFWVEHVIRHKGGSHLKNYGTYIPWYHYYMFDVFFLVSFIVNGSIAVVVMFLRDYASIVSPPHLFVVTFIFLINVFILETHICLFRLMRKFIG